jgi:hypothetical protein
MLGLVLAEFDAAPPAAAQLAEIRLVLADAERVADNRQYALEQIDDIVSRGKL